LLGAPRRFLILSKLAVDHAQIGVRFGFPRVVVYLLLIRLRLAAFPARWHDLAIEMPWCSNRWPAVAARSRVIVASSG
jgi:hypothetical protein